MHWPSELEWIAIGGLLFGIAIVDRLSRIIHLLEAIHRMIFKQVYPSDNDW